ncbi:F-type H+-transporting ATPase subunit b [Loktanella sp. DSM 29012]|uniref:ATP synthase subunit b n=1 Tax=Loktanella gaetbuli TaxID=2881335 RepID=A0ABS8BW84_9RHOB|nr:MULTISPECIES: F0F1 ATP synthase subunit B [Loktanella]MCB5200005.1 F0F1 ATP synthase subunit B [Loktanella gaetbuli]SEQ41254.1 F-type H+-transporting ATPase subunit b [Loktanella sp. DSM 29012]
MRHILIAVLALSATPALAAGDVFFSLANTDFVVTLGFLLFIAILLYFKVPGKVTEMLDSRAVGIQSDLDEARALREEAQTLLASYERKQKEVQEQADRIVANARQEAERSAEAAKAEIASNIDRRLAGAEEQLAAARAAAIRDVRDQAIMVAVAASKDVIAKNMDAKRTNALIDESIDTVKAKMH